ncbi:S1 family peptidase [Streptomyces sp. NPDC048172]|uniref:S1 family peptidase n=1 Tax=Streptomyces sp. NPDC048172 TaxID=3365505 RepID=UPI00371AEFAE
MRKHRGISKRRVLIAGTGIAALTAGTLTLATNASADQAAPTARTLSAKAASELAPTLTGDIKGDAGAYYDAKAKQLVVNVTDAAGKAKAEAAGARARLVDHSMAQLKDAKAALGETRTVGTSRGVDTQGNRVLVTADSTVKGAKLAQLKKEIKAQGGKAELKRVKGEFSTKIAGGDAIWGSGARCSLGFNVTVNGQPGFLTAGHCTNIVQSWSDSQGGGEIAATQSGTFPGSDHGLAMYTADTDHPSAVDLYNGSTQEISGAGEATVGQQVQRSGSTTQVHDGTVEALNVDVDYAEGTVRGTIQTNVCAEPGDSGGALFAGDQALGLTSGGSGDCSSGGQTFFQPVGPALEAYGASIP